MRIAFVGSRGIPACYSGFETFVEQLATRLVRRGHEVTVYNRVPFNRYAGDTLEGVRIVRVGTVPTKGTDTLVHTALSLWHGLGEDYDIVYLCGVGSSLLALVPRLNGARTVLNVDGADFARAKWSGFGRWWLRQSERWAVRLGDAVIADNGTIQNRYREWYGAETRLIPYGSNVVTSDPGRTALERYGLRPDGYLLYVSRLTPENAADLTIEAYLGSGVALPLVVVGDAPYQSDYLRKLNDLAAGHPHVLMTGYQFGDTYEQLSFHARAFVLPTAIDATRPVLLDQMGFGNCVIVRDTPGNLEVVGDAGLTFPDADPVRGLAAAMKRVAADPVLAREMGVKARARVAEHYDWSVITRQYERLFEELVKRG